MSEQGGLGAAGDAVLNGVLTGVWYALPDVVASRRARGWLKVAVILGGAARAGRTAAHADAADDGDGDVPMPEADLTALVARMATEPVIDAESLGPGGAPPNRARRLRVAGVVLAALSVVGSVTGERAIHRWGERLTARGVRYAHTRIGLVAGGVTGVSTWALARD